MLEAYKQRRAAKHAAERSVKIDNYLPVLTPSMESVVARETAMRIPKLSWLNFKTRKQSNGGTKNISGYCPEWDAALVENGSRTFEQQVDKALIENLESTEA